MKKYQRSTEDLCGCDNKGGAVFEGNTVVAVENSNHLPVDRHGEKIFLLTYMYNNGVLGFGPLTFEHVAAQRDN